MRYDGFFGKQPRYKSTEPSVSCLTQGFHVKKQHEKQLEPVSNAKVTLFHGFNLFHCSHATLLKDTAASLRRKTTSTRCFTLKTHSFNKYYWGNQARKLCDVSLSVHKCYLTGV